MAELVAVTGVPNSLKNADSFSNDTSLCVAQRLCSERKNNLLGKLTILCLKIVSIFAHGLMRSQN